VSTASAVTDIIQAVADHMAGLLVYISTGGSPIFGTLHELFLVGCYNKVCRPHKQSSRIRGVVYSNFYARRQLLL